MRELLIRWAAEMDEVAKREGECMKAKLICWILEADDIATSIIYGLAKGYLHK